MYYYGEFYELNIQIQESQFVYSFTLRNVD
jgi:hypothetical protein